MTTKALSITKNNDNNPPNVAVRWMIQHTSSNVELATVSNVCRRWREIASKTILEELLLDTVSGAVVEVEEEDNNKNNDESDVQTKTKEKNTMARNNTGHSPSYLSSLLLPSTAALLASYTQYHQQQRAPMKIDTKREETNETYCVAWFHPDGIEFKQLALDGNDNDENNTNHFGGRPGTRGIYAGDHRVTSGEEAFAPSGELFYVGSDHGREEGIGRHKGEQFRRNQSHRSPLPVPHSSSFPVVGTSTIGSPQIQNSSTSMVPASNLLQQRQQSKDRVSCVYQWNGYTEVMDILRPFGYAPSFVRVSLIFRIPPLSHTEYN